MKNVFYILIVFITMVSYSQESAFKIGEKLKYKLSYSNFLTAGYATINIEEDTHLGEQAYHIVGKGKTTGMINWFFKVRDNYETYINPKTLLPYRFIRQINEGGYAKDKEILFDQIKNNVTVFNKKDNSTTNFSVEKNVQDILSALYFMRNKDISNFKIGNEISLPIFIDEEIMNMKLRFLGREIINTKFGKIKTAKFMPLVASGRIFKEQESVIVWVSDDLNKIPLLIKASLAVGSLRADLYQYKHLNNMITFKD